MSLRSVPRRATRPKATFHRLVVTEHRRGGDYFERVVTLYTQALKLPEEERRNIYFACARDIVERRRSDGPVWYPIHTFPREWLAPIAAELAAGREHVVY
jgi:hypothetical protein